MSESFELNPSPASRPDLPPSIQPPRARQRKIRLTGFNRWTRVWLGVLLGLSPLTARVWGSSPSDSLGIIPRPIFGIEDKSLRFGCELTITRIFLPLNQVSPWVEAGIRYFERLTTSPDDKKAFLLRGGILIPTGWLNLAPSLGLVTGAGSTSAEFGFGCWVFPGARSRERPLELDYPDYGAWLEAIRLWEEDQGETANIGIGLGSFLSPWLSPKLNFSLALAIFF